MGSLPQEENLQDSLVCHISSFFLNSQKSEKENKENTGNLLIFLVSSSSCIIHLYTACRYIIERLCLFLCISFIKREHS